MRFSKRSIAIFLLYLSCAALPAFAENSSSDSSSSDSDSDSGDNEAKCPKPLRDDDGCERIKDYDDLKDEIEDMRDGDTKCFKKFSVEKSRKDDEIKIKNKAINIICADIGGCEIEGGGNHIEIDGDDAEVMIQGFKFVGATNSAIKIMEDSGKDGPDNGHDQKICDCEFHRNEADHGGAIRMYRDTKAYVRYSTFTKNYSEKDGGAIQNDGGRLKVMESEFEDNEADDEGGAIATRNAGIMILQDNEFINNKAGEVGPAAATSGRYDDDGGNKGRDNDEEEKCNGVYDLDREKCYKFDDDHRGSGGSGSGDEDDDDSSTTSHKYDDDDDDDSGNNDKEKDDDDDDDDSGKNYDADDDDDDDDSGKVDYGDSDHFGPFRLKLFWKNGYRWQETDRDWKLCMECDGSCSVDNRFELKDCSSSEDDQYFYAVGDTIRNADNKNLCMTYIDQRGVVWQKCNGSSNQKWSGLKKSGEFLLQPVTDKRRCATNHHHPREDEMIYLEWCPLAIEAQTAYWELRW